MKKNKTFVITNLDSGQEHVISTDSMKSARKLTYRIYGTFRMKVKETK